MLSWRSFSWGTGGWPGLADSLSYLKDSLPSCGQPEVVKTPDSWVSGMAQSLAPHKTVVVFTGLLSRVGLWEPGCKMSHRSCNSPSPVGGAVLRHCRIFGVDSS